MCEEFESWCKEYELEDTTVQLLVKNGYKTYRSIALMPDEFYTKLKKDISSGQHALLGSGLNLLRLKNDPPKGQSGEDTNQEEYIVKAVEALLTSKGLLTSPAPAAPGGATAQDQLTAAAAATAATTTARQDPATTNADKGAADNPQGSQQQPLPDLAALWASLAGGNPKPADQPPAGMILPSDAFGFGSGPYSGSKLRHVGDYITNIYAIDPHHDQEDTAYIGGVHFSVAKTKRVPLDKIKLEHYMEASLRILSEAIMEDNLPMTQVINHINYLIQIAVFAQSNTHWRRILNYDTIYRREQQSLGFAWGTNSPFLHQSQLNTPPAPPGTAVNSTMSKKPPQAGGKPSKPFTGDKWPDVFHPKTGQKLCNKWNGKYGCNLQVCNFMHCCRTCFSSEHTEAHHHQGATADHPTKNA